jgi:Mlc titration factor MtfA (ptsG expression regulator)
MITWLKNWLFGRSAPIINIQWQAHWSDFLHDNVVFYQQLAAVDREQFEQRTLLFLQTTQIEAGDERAEETDCLLVAASAIIPVWQFPGWQYFNLAKVFILPAAFNAEFQCGQPDSQITGMVGTGPMAGMMALSGPALRYGFANARDKQNVGIHEFVHLIDMADGEVDGYPERLKEFAFSIPWFELVAQKVEAIERRENRINPYALTNRAEFFSVVSEYFFERPALLEKKHPHLYKALSEVYRQDEAAISRDRKKNRSR